MAKRIEPGERVVGSCIGQGRKKVIGALLQRPASSFERYLVIAEDDGLAYSCIQITRVKEEHETDIL